MTNEQNTALWGRLVTAASRLELDPHDLIKASQYFGLFSPAFNGVLLALVREAWGDEFEVEISILCDGSCILDIKRSGDDQAGWSDWAADSLGDALVAALEAAP